LLEQPTVTANNRARARMSEVRFMVLGDSYIDFGNTAFPGSIYLRPALYFSKACATWTKQCESIVSN
jgi:hypothetical protein